VGYHGRVNRHESALFILFLPFYLAAFGLYQFMVFAVNRQLPARERIPHSLFWRGWSRVKQGYRELYPRSAVYQLSMVCAVVSAAIALAFLSVRIYEYTHGQLR